MTHCAIYTRVSTDEQVATGTSLDVQRERGEAYVTAHGWVNAGVFSDEGVSGAKTERLADRIDALLDRLSTSRDSLQKHLETEKRVRADGKARKAARESVRRIAVKMALTAED